MKTAGLVLLALIVYVLHQDFWNWNRYEPLLFGFLPIGLWYHALYAFLCAFTMWVLGKLAWPEHLETVEAEVLKHPQKGEGH